MGRHVGPIMQLGYVVDDLDAAIDHWTRVLGVGPFFVTPSVAFEEVHCRGRPVALDHAVAIAQDGPLQVELIRQTSAEPSIFSEFLARRGPGLHHVCALTDDLARDVAAFAARGVEVLQGGRTAAGIPFAYLDTDPDDRGRVLELVQPSRGLLRFFDHVRQAAEDWDGTDPRRDL